VLVVHVNSQISKLGLLVCSAYLQSDRFYFQTLWKYWVLSHLIVCTCFPFSDIIRGVIDDVVAGFVVLPNRITVPLTDVDPYELKYPMPDVSECLLIVFTVFLAGFLNTLLPNGPFVSNSFNFK